MFALGPVVVKVIKVEKTGHSSQAHRVAVGGVAVFEDLDTEITITLEKENAKVLDIRCRGEDSYSEWL